MSLGVGLGSFMKGMVQGYGIGRDIAKQNEVDTRNQRIREATQETKDKFGDVLSDEAYTHMMKKQALIYAESGDMSKAEEFRKWSDSQDAKSGTKLFARGLAQFQNGDLDGGFRTTQELARLKGYGDVFDMKSWQPIVDGDGKRLGTRVTMAGPDGKAVTQDIPAGREAEVLARAANPPAAFEAETKRRDASAKSRGELAEYEEKKKIDQRYAGGENPTKQREDAIKALRDNSRTFGAKSDKTFDELDDAGKEAEIAREIRLRRPGTSPQASAPGASPSPGIGAVAAPQASAAAAPARRGGYVNDTVGQTMTVPQAQARAGIGAPAAAAGNPQPPAPPPGLGRVATPTAAAPAAAAQGPGMQARAGAPADDAAMARADLAKLDQEIEQVTSRSKNETAATMLLGPLTSKRAQLQNEIDTIERSRATPR